MVNRNREQVRRNIETLTYDLDGSVEDAIKYLERILKDNPTACLSYEDVAGSYDPDTRMGLVVYVYEPETDDEMNTRIVGEETREERAKEHRRRQLEELKKEFGE